jgi:hypothetical protein
MIEYEIKPYAGSCPLYRGMCVASVKLKGFLTEDAFESTLDKAGYHSVYENVYERQAIYDKVLMSYIMRGYKVCVRGAGCFYPYIQETPFKPDNFSTARDIPKVYVCREPEKMLCKEIHVTDKDIKRYEERRVEEGRLFGC